VSEPAAREAILATFRWVDGHADIWRLFGDPTTFGSVVRRVAEVVAESGASKVAGVESRGFILGGAVAAAVGVGFVPIRKETGLFPGDKLTVRADADYRGHQHLLRMQRDALRPDDRVLLVDDWAELGSQALAARELVERASARWAGLALIVDQLPAKTRALLAPVTSVVTADELGPSDTGPG
jgi:adenine phosphoribosyltransferase